MSFLKLSGGTIHDPANGVDGVVEDLWIRDGKVVQSPESELTENVKVLDVSGLVVMPGGVDMHCHVAGPKVNMARKMQPEQIRKAIAARSVANIPDIYTTGFRYTGLGYTTCFDAAISPLAARHVHHEFNEIPNVDTGFYVLVGNNHYLMNSIAEGDDEKVRTFLGWLLERVGGFAPKIVNPGGVEIWKQRRDGNARDLDQTIDGFNVTPKRIIDSITRAANELGLPHPVHIHCNNLGLPGNWKTTLETMKVVSGQKAHLTHIQFHSYGGGMGDGDYDAETTLHSQVKPLAEFVNANPDLTVDVGQIMFGPTTSMTGDGPLGYYLHQISGKKWYSCDTELESGCGISPIDYRNRNFIHALQWAIGLEWYLLVDDPWQVVMSTDHPNGGSFLAYPQIIRLLMDSSFRANALQRVNKKVLKHSCLADLKREYSLNEIAIITRAGPARILGLSQKGHLGVGADADITVYLPDENYEKMFSVPKYVFKAGNRVVDDFEIRAPVSGNTLTVGATYESGFCDQIENWFNDHYSLNVRHYGIGEDEFSRMKVVE